MVLSYRSTAPTVPDITIAPGEKQFFRVINATGHKTLRLKSRARNCSSLRSTVSRSTLTPARRPTETENDLIVPPAARAEFIVTGPKVGRARFRTLCYNTGPNGDPDRRGLSRASCGAEETAIRRLLFQRAAAPSARPPAKRLHHASYRRRP